VSSVVRAPRLAARLGETRAMLAALATFAVLLLADPVGSHTVVAAVTVLSGATLGLFNTFYTGAAMSVSSAPRPVASAGYNCLRWFGGGLGAFLVGHIAGWGGNVQAPFLVAALCVALGAALLVLGRGVVGEKRVLPAAAAAHSLDAA
jgi:MFS transporter, ACDE family, multidrug resistance protein